MIPQLDFPNRAQNAKMREDLIASRKALIDQISKTQREYKNIIETGALDFWIDHQRLMLDLTNNLINLTVLSDTLLTMLPTAPFNDRSSLT